MKKIAVILLLTLTFNIAFADEIFKAIEADPATELKIDLPNQTITLKATGQSESFEINDYKKGNMLNGYDDIDYLMSMGDSISEFAENTPL